jgi:hypothetical protein
VKPLGRTIRMKIRSGFVSNSSSSSFLVAPSIVYAIPHMPPNLRRPHVLMVPYIFGGMYEFGRERVNYTDFGSRLNWAYIQARSVNYLSSNSGGLDKGFLKSKQSFLKAHKNDLKLLEEVLIESIPGVTEIEWLIITENEKNHVVAEDEPDDYDRKRRHVDGYIDHGSMWYEKQHEYEVIFENKSTIFQWLFGSENYIANRSDEFDDMKDLEVNHKLDYEYDIEDLYYNPWNDPELFDAHANFIKDEVLVATSDNEGNILTLTEEPSLKYINYFSDNAIKASFEKKLKQRGWDVYCDEMNGRFVIKLRRL